MPSLCVVEGCKSSTDMNKKKDSEHIKFFGFPKNGKVLTQWIEACGNKKFNSKFGRICSLHFTEDDWRLKDILLKTPIEKRYLKPNAVPSIMISEKKKNKETIAKEDRAAQRISKNLVESAIKDYDTRTLIEQDQSTSETLHVSMDYEISTTAKSVAIQTEVQYKCPKELKIMELKEQIRALKEENAKNRIEMHRFQNLENSIRNIFTSGQIKKLKNPYQKINWSIEDISAAISLHSAGPRAYKFLYDNNHPLPGPSTLKTWIRKINSSSDVLQSNETGNNTDDKENGNIIELESIQIIQYDELPQVVLENKVESL